jgi:hypothetical protein
MQVKESSVAGRYAGKVTRVRNSEANTLDRLHGKVIYLGEIFPCASSGRQRDHIHSLPFCVSGTSEQPIPHGSTVLHMVLIWAFSEALVEAAPGCAVSDEAHHLKVWLSRASPLFLTPRAWHHCWNCLLVLRFRLHAVYYYADCDICRRCLVSYDIKRRDVDHFSLGAIKVPPRRPRARGTRTSTAATEEYG